MPASATSLRQGYGGPPKRFTRRRKRARERSERERVGPHAHDIKMTDKSQTTLESVEITRAALDAIAGHGVETYPHECCGALIEREGRIVEAWPLENTTIEGPRRRFLVSPKDYLAAEARARELGGTLAGFYHSHPDHPARPSQHDLEHAWPNLAYVIVSVTEGVAGAVTCWRLRDDRSSFEQKDLKWPIAS